MAGGLSIGVVWCVFIHNNNEDRRYLDVEVAVEALDEDDEGPGQVVPRRRLDGHAGVLRPRTNQEALHG